MVGFCPTMYGASARKTRKLGWLCYLGLVSPGGVLTHVWQWVLTFSKIPTRGLGCTAWWLVPRARVSKDSKEAASVSGLGLQLAEHHFCSILLLKQSRSSDSRGRMKTLSSWWRSSKEFGGFVIKITTDVSIFLLYNFHNILLPPVEESAQLATWLFLSIPFYSLFLRVSCLLCSLPYPCV